MSEGKPKVIEFWIKLWGTGMIAAALSFPVMSRLFPDRVEATFGNEMIKVALGMMLIWGKRTQGLRTLQVVFAVIGGIGTSGLGFYHYNNGVQTVGIYYYVLCVFYIGLFAFLMMPGVKKAFGPPKVPAPLPELTDEEELKIKFWVRIIGIIFFLEGFGNFIFRDWLREHGLPWDGNIGVTLAILTAFGLLFLKRNLGRTLALFVCFGSFLGLLTLHFDKVIFGFWGYFETFFLMLFFFLVFIFLLHPKTKSVFK